MKIPQNLLDICKYLEEKKAEEIVVIDTSKMPNVANYNIIATATSTTHTKGIADYLEEQILNNSSLNLFNREGFNLSEWIILDCDEIFVHIFTKTKREYYNLEKLLNEGGNAKTYEKLLKEAKKQSEKEQKVNKEQKTKVVKPKKEKYAKEEKVKDKKVKENKLKSSTKIKKNKN